MLASYGSNLALGFKGDPSFIERCFNWASNTGVLRPGAQLYWYYGEGGRLAYVCPKSLKAIKLGLFRQFQAEIILNKEVPLKADHSRDDEWMEANEGKDLPIVEHEDYKIARLAAQRAGQFLKDHMIHDSFFLRRNESVLMPFGMGSNNRADNHDE